MDQTRDQQPVPADASVWRQRLKTVLGGLLLAGMLAWGTSQVLAASPEPAATDNQPAASLSATDDSTDRSTDKGHGDCPNKDSDSSSDSTSDSSSGSSS
jgi:hypothetical protein